ncbi:MAG: hypothetical protein KDK06_16815 [Gammaproteobacteria bacterium]|nr:hypothetical protein [Gammaproteobacteria bacterium]
MSGLFTLAYLRLSKLAQINLTPFLFFSAQINLTPFLPSNKPDTFSLRSKLAQINLTPFLFVTPFLFAFSLSLFCFRRLIPEGVGFGCIAWVDVPAAAEWHAPPGPDLRGAEQGHRASPGRRSPPATITIASFPRPA